MCVFVFVFVFVIGTKEIKEGRNTTLFTTEGGIVGGRILEGDGGFDGQGGHIGGGQSLVELGGRKKEIDLIGLQVVVERQRRDEIIVV